MAWKFLTLIHLMSKQHSSPLQTRNTLIFVGLGLRENQPITARCSKERVLTRPLSQQLTTVVKVGTRIAHTKVRKISKTETQLILSLVLFYSSILYCIHRLRAETRKSLVFIVLIFFDEIKTQILVLELGVIAFFFNTNFKICEITNKKSKLKI
jgi:hypothetical protein